MTNQDKNHPNRFRVVYSTPISCRSSQIVSATTAKQAVDVVKAMEIPTEIHYVELQMSQRKWEVVNAE